MKYRLLGVVFFLVIAGCMHGAAIAFAVWLWGVHIALATAFVLFWAAVSVTQFVVGSPAMLESWHELQALDEKRNERKDKWSV